MASQHVENVHLKSLNKLLSDSGLECVRSPLLSTESSSITGTAEELGPAEEQEEVAPEVVEEEEKKSVIEEVQESLPEVFPTPSLRLVLTDKVREIEQQNRIHVLPEEFKTDIDPQAIPKIRNTPQQKYIDILAELVGCTRYKSSLAEFWFLDTLANLLRRAQEDKLDRPTQAVLMLWFCEWMKEIEQFDAADRSRMMKRFQDTMLTAAKYIVENEQLPTPAQAGVYYKAQKDHEGHETTFVKNQLPQTESTIHFGYECYIRDLTKIIHYIFDLFSTDFQYDLVRSVFTFTPDYALIDAPYQIQNPKKLYVPIKVKPKKPQKSPKMDGTKGGKGKKIETNEEYLALMEQKAKEERILAEQEEKEREQWTLKSQILPLNFAATEELFNKYWPPPPPPPESELTVTDGKGKGKGKGKK